MKKTNNNGEKKGVLSKFFGNVADNVKEGASFVGEKVARTSAKAYVASTELVSETSDKIHDFTDKQDLHREEKKISERQQTLKFSFGELTLTHYLKNETLHKTYLTTKDVSDVVAEYVANEKRLKAIDKEIREIEKH